MTKDEAVERFPWKNPPPNLDYDFFPCKLFEEFLTDEILSHICQETIRYAISKGREDFTIDLHSLKGFICILLISGYNALPRRAMYWQPTDDVYNASVSSIMTIFRFCLDLVVQNAYQIYRLQARGVSKKLDSLGFRRAIVEVYSKKYIKDLSGLFKHLQMCQSNEVRYDNVDHWIKKATQRRCQNKPCKGTTLYCCEKCTVALDPECFKAYHTC